MYLNNYNIDWLVFNAVAMQSQLSDRDCYKPRILKRTVLVR